MTRRAEFLLLTLILCYWQFACKPEDKNQSPTIGAHQELNLGKPESIVSEKLPNGVEHWELVSKEEDSIPAFFRMIETLGNVVLGRDNLPFRRTVAFLVGVSEYPQLNPQLPFVENDLDDMRDYLLQEGGVDEVFLARGRIATASLVKDYMANRFRTSLDRDDRLIFYFAGHGTDGGGTTGYIQLYDAKPNDFAEGVVPISDVREWSRLIPAKHILFLFDSCSSGLGITSRSTYGDSRKQIVSTLSKNGSRTVITAGFGNERTFEVPSATDDRKGNGVFTRAFLDVLRSNNSSGYLTINEVFAGLEVKIARFAERNGRKLSPRRWALDESDYPGTFLFLTSNPNSLRRSLEEYKPYLDSQPRQLPEGDGVLLDLTRATNLRSLGLLALKRGNLPKASSLLGRALEIREGVDSEGLVFAESLTDLGFVALQEGALERAEAYFQRSIQLSESLEPEGTQIARNLNGLGLLDLERGNLDGATENFFRALTILRESVPLGLATAETLQNLGRAALEAGDLAAAEDFLNRASEIIKAQAPRSRLNTAHHQAMSILNRARGDYFLASQAAQNAVDSFEREYSRVGGSSVEKAVFRSQQELFHAKYINLLAQKPEKITFAFDQLSVLNARSLLSSLTSLSGRNPVGQLLGDIQNNLRPGTAILAYSVGQDNLEIFLATPKFTVHQSVAYPRDLLERSIQRLREQFIRDRDLSSDEKRIRVLSARLYASLILPIESHLAGSDRIVIVPDGPLNLLPFSALYRESSEQYLVEWKPSSKVHSALILNRIRSRQVEADTLPISFLGVADSGQDGLLPPLPGSRKEVTRAASLFSKSRIYIGEKATKSNFLAQAPSSQIIHIGIHSSPALRGPLSSILHFYSKDRKKVGSGRTFTRSTDFEDPSPGDLTAMEVPEQLDLMADLVVLAGCSTSGGILVPDEGLMSLSWAFLASGAASTISSLWDVDDQATAELMIHFYTHLVSGQSKSEALRQSQLQLLRQKRFSSPYFWAPFELYGDWIEVSSSG